MKNLVTGNLLYKSKKDEIKKLEKKHKLSFSQNLPNLERRAQIADEYLLSNQNSIKTIALNYSI